MTDHIMPPDDPQDAEDYIERDDEYASPKQYPLFEMLEDEHES